jgi:hypothetical protein
MAPLFKMLDAPLPSRERVPIGFTGCDAKGKPTGAPLCPVVDHGPMRHDPPAASDGSEPDDNC